VGWQIVGSRVYDLIDRDAPDDVWYEFYLTAETLAQEGPYPDDLPGMGVLVYQDPTKPNSFTIPFDHGLLVYQVMKDQPVVKLLDAFWADD
jgi:hypothetical protein